LFSEKALLPVEESYQKEEPTVETQRVVVLEVG
jgi:hypothetical protein